MTSYQSYGMTFRTGARKKRIFISFAYEDKNLRDLLVGQSKNDDCPFEFVDMSVKEPWDEKWKTNCRTRIKGCDGALVIVTNNSSAASGQLWEYKCAKEEGILCLGVWGYSDHLSTKVPNELTGLRIVNWKWDTIANWIERL